MSIDNGVYILKTGNQYRVKHLQAIDNLWWDEPNRKLSKHVQPDMVLDMFGDSPYTYCQNTAFKIAGNILKKIPICEYGIQVIDAGMSWGRILNTAGQH